MKTLCLFGIIMFVLAISACAGHSVKSQAAPMRLTAEVQQATPESFRPQDALNATATREADGAGTAELPATSSVLTIETPIPDKNSPSHSSSEPTQASADFSTTATEDADTIYGEKGGNDPWEGYNRRIYSFNNTFDKAIARPLAIAYEKVMPDPAQVSVTRFFGNLREPATAVNQALQGRPVNALRTLGRVVVNSTVGVAGLFDPATHFGMQRDHEDFGQTLAVWGWRDSRYFVMPLLGPRTVRDTVGIFGDQPLSPIGSVDNSAVAYSLNVLQLTDARAHLLPMDDTRREALDEYLMVRDAWMQRRSYQIEKDLRSSN